MEGTSCFNLEDAMLGKKVCTRSGSPVTIINFGIATILGWVANEQGCYDGAEVWTIDGKCRGKRDYDLMMVEED